VARARDIITTAIIEKPSAACTENDIRKGIHGVVGEKTVDVVAAFVGGRKGPEVMVAVGGTAM